MILRPTIFLPTKKVFNTWPAFLLVLWCAFLLTTHLSAQPIHPTHLLNLSDSGGNLIREQAAYDVKFYRLKFTIDTARHSLAGDAFVRATTNDTLSTLVLDLDSTLSVDSVIWRA